MGIKAYSLPLRHNVTIKGPLTVKKYALPNGNVAQIICGKSKNMQVVCTIVTNTKPKPCKNGKPRSRKGAKCSK